MGALRSIRLRLTLWYVALLAVILAAFSAGIYLTLRHNPSANLDDSLETRAAVLLQAIDFDEGRPTLEGPISPAGSEVDDGYVRVYDAVGALTFDSSGGEGLSPAPPEAVSRALAGRSTTGSVEAGKDSMRTYFAPVEQNEEVVGVLEVGLSDDDISGTLSTLLLILAIAYPATLAVASVGGVFLAGRALSPIDRITRLAGRISGEDLSQRVDMAPAADEVGRLAGTFNDMIARLEEAFRRQRQFTADASHELRTPLTAIKGQIEVALSRQRGVDAYREVLGGVNEEVDRLIRLVGSLLTLARADAGEIPIASELVDVGELIAQAAEQVRPAAAQKGIEVAVEPGPPLTPRADQDLLLQLLLNLLDNAVKYTERGRITVGWEVDGGARLWVRDTGIGIAPEHAARVFDRFYRVDQARSRAEGGAGLGLSISRWIAEVHGGALTLQSEPGRGTTVELRLPLG